MTKTDNPSAVDDSPSLMRPSIININKIEKNPNNIFIALNKKRRFIEISLMHFINNTKPKNLKKVTLSCSDKIIGCSWDQFATDTVAAINYAINFISSTYIVIQQDKILRTTYFNFNNVKDAEKIISAAIVYDDRLVDVYKTVKLEEGTQIITIPSFKKVNIINLRDEIKNLFTPHGTIVDGSAFKMRNKNGIHPFGLKFLFKKSNGEFEIPNFLELDNNLMTMTYNKNSTAVHNSNAEIKKKVTAKNLEQKTGSILQKFVKIDCDFNDKTINKSTELPNSALKNYNSVADNDNAVEGFILDINGNIITSPNAKLSIWTKYFGDLVDDTTGNKVIIALKAAPNNKAAGINTIPSEILKLEISIIVPIAANKLSRIEQKYNILANEQADFDKTYDKVSQSALLTKIKSVGIGGKLLSFIESLYKNPKMCVRIDNQVSQLVNFNYVSGLTTKISGLLFAYNAVVVAEALDTLKLALNTITKWADVHEMQINSSKRAGVGKNASLNRHRIDFADLTKNPIKAGASTWISDRYDKNDKSKIYIFIKTHNMGTTSNWINLQLLDSEIKLGLEDIGKI
ncbi:hypothetical protein BB561_004134 [Smittium simulii]|uniref:Uncharacterized protein n=1 Tax=Smittium simulii TaxID=133385 RepID=A0A2T9YHY0_9FUNG|nr:hypothetical protein BB561_004134 [Smittium simulii]